MRYPNTWFQEGDDDYFTIISYDPSRGPDAGGVPRHAIKIEGYTQPKKDEFSQAWFEKRANNPDALETKQLILMNRPAVRIRTFSLEFDEVFSSTIIDLGNDKILIIRYYPELSVLAEYYDLILGTLHQL